MTGACFAMSPCIGCGRLFAYHPDLVPSIAIKTGTGPAYGRPAEYDPAGVREPICPHCARRANPERAAAGLPLIDERDTMDLITEDGL